MQNFTGWQYLLIDEANQFGMTKDLFEDRIEWAEKNIDILETLADQAETKPLYVKAVLAVRKVQQGLPTGHVVGLDACCSGIQVMSALTGCYHGAYNTGLVNPNERSDAYSTVTTFMQTELGPNFSVSRADAKDALMTSFYGSTAKPKEIYGVDTPELDAFYKAASQVAPGAWELLEDLLKSWQPYALKHEWQLPDGFNAVVKVMEKIESRVEVDELDHTTFTYTYYENRGSKSGLSLVANVIHSVDAYILRSMHRRCNYDTDVFTDLLSIVSNTLYSRTTFNLFPDNLIDSSLTYYVEQFDRSNMIDLAIAPYISAGNVNQLSTTHLIKLDKLLSSVLENESFELLTLHDEFKASPNNMNVVRKHYIEIFADLADSNLLNDLLSQIHGSKCSFRKLSTNLSSFILNSNYALS